MWCRHFLHLLHCHVVSTFCVRDHLHFLPLWHHFVSTFFEWFFTFVTYHLYQHFGCTIIRYFLHERHRHFLSSWINTFLMMLFHSTSPLTILSCFAQEVMDTLLLTDDYPIEVKNSHHLHFSVWMLVQTYQSIPLSNLKTVVTFVLFICMNKAKI